MRPEKQPECERQRRYRHDDRDKHANHPVGKRLNRRFAPLRRLDEPDNLREQRVRAGLGDLKAEAAGFVQGAAHHPVAHAFTYRDGFAGQHRLVDVRAAVQHGAVDRNLFARTDAHDVAGAHVAQGQLEHHPLTLDPRRLRA